MRRPQVAVRARRAAPVLALLAALLAAAPPACADATAAPSAAAGATDPALERALAPIRAQLSAAQVLRGRFEQARELAELPQPLRSSGRFLFARGHGIWWHTEQPFASDFTLTPARMVLADGSGEALRLDAQQQPGLRLVSQLFLSLFALDLPTLQAHFAIRVLPATRGWALALTPREAALSQIAQRLQLSGGAFVEEVQLFDPRGERTLIRLREVAASDAAPSADELQRLAQ